MRLFGMFRKEWYSAQCRRCHERVSITREEVEAGRYTCPVCNDSNPIPDAVRAEYEKNRAKDELRERRHKERERQRAQKEMQRRQRVAAKQRARQEELERSRKRAETREASLRAGRCPDCGAQLQVLRKTFDGRRALSWGCLSYLLGFGYLGALAGFGSGTEMTRVCGGCGREFPFSASRLSKTTNVVTTVVAIIIIVIVLIIFVWVIAVRS